MFDALIKNLWKVNSSLEIKWFPGKYRKSLYAMGNNECNGSQWLLYISHVVSRVTLVLSKYESIPYISACVFLKKKKEIFYQYIE
jgi:hypothetical protein